jgi:hypothetical protein
VNDVSQLDEFGDGVGSLGAFIDLICDGKKLFEHPARENNLSAVIKRRIRRKEDWTTVQL